MNQTVLTKIDEEHFKLRELMKCVQHSIDLTTKKKAYNVLKHELVEHMKGEEDSIYRYIQGLTLGKSYDHHEIKECLQRLNLMKMTDKNWDEAYTVLCKCVEEHCGDEEEDLFFVVGKSFDSDFLVVMAKEYNLGKLDGSQWN